jgi:hypothetical protein
MAVHKQAALSGQKAGNQGLRREYRRRAIFTCMHDDEKAQTQFPRRIICRSSARARQISLHLLFHSLSRPTYPHFLSIATMRINKLLFGKHRDFESPYSILLSIKFGAQFPVHTSSLPNLHQTQKSRLD